MEWFFILLVVLIAFVLPYIMHNRQTEVILRNEFGETRKLNIGYSWSMLVFNGFVPLIRNDWIGGIVLIIINLLTSGLVSVVYAFFYNKQYFKKMRRKGFIYYDESLESKLKDAKYLDESGQVENKLLVIVTIAIVFLIGVIVYQSKVFDKLFPKDTIECNSTEAIDLSKEIIRNKIFPKVFNNSYTIEDIEINSIYTKEINKDTGARECKATANIITNVDLVQKKMQESTFKYFNLILGTDNFIDLGDGKILSSSSIWYTTELSDNKEEYLVNLKFDGDRTKSIDTKNLLQNNKSDLELLLPFAEKGNAYIQNKVGVIYENGNKVEKNLAEAFNWYEKAALQNNAWALNNLAKMYYIGNYVKEDFNKAFKYYKKSAELGNYLAQNTLGNMYFNGNGTTVDSEKAIYWYEKSAAQNYDMALSNLAFIYENAKGVEQDLNKAIFYYEKAIQMNNAFAQYSLGNLYYEGKKIKQDYDKAFNLIKKSALQNNKEAQFFLARMYIMGQGTKVNIKEAKKFFTLSSQQGNEDAKKMLKVMEEKGL